MASKKGGFFLEFAKEEGGSGPGFSLRRSECLWLEHTQVVLGSEWRGEAALKPSPLQTWAVLLESASSVLF